MITDISTILGTYAAENDYYFLLEYNSGANQLLDKFLLGTQEYAIYENIIENGEVTRDDNGRTITLTRTIEICIFKKSPTKDDMGENYYPIINDLENRILNVYQYLLQNLTNIGTTANIETGIDRMDATLVMAKITFSIEDKLIVC